MFLLMLAAFILVPLIEITVIVQVAGVIGGWNTVGLLLLVSVVGAWLVRHEGWIVMRRIREQLDAGRVPGKELTDGALLLVGGVLMLTPGFVTDAVGLLLVFPPTRAIVRGALYRRFAGQVEVFGLGGTREWRGPRRPGGPDDVIDV